MLREGWRPPPLKHHQARRLIEDIGRVGARRTLDLTAQEQRVLGMVADGMVRGEIAETLRMSEHTVIHYQRQIRQKLGARTLAHAVAISLRPPRAA